MGIVDSFYPYFTQGSVEEFKIYQLTNKNTFKELQGRFPMDSDVTIRIDTDKPYKIDNVSDILKNATSGHYYPSNMFEDKVSEKSQKMIAQIVIYSIIRPNCNILNIKHI